MRFLEIQRGNKNTLGEINVLMNAMAKKPLITRSSHISPVLKWSWNLLLENRWHNKPILGEKPLFRINRDPKTYFNLIIKDQYLLPQI